MIVPFEATKTHYTLVKFVKSVGVRYRWQREDGVWLSPSFATAACAKLYAERMPMLTAEEWQEQEIEYPL